MINPEAVYALNTHTIAAPNVLRVEVLGTVSVKRLPTEVRTRD